MYVWYVWVGSCGGGLGASAMGEIYFSFSCDFTLSFRVRWCCRFESDQRYLSFRVRWYGVSGQRPKVVVLKRSVASRLCSCW